MTEFEHDPVMRDEIVDTFRSVPAGVVLDATLGGGGHSEAILESQAFKPPAVGHGPGIHHGPSLLDYRIPTSLDTPELESFIVESVDPEGPYGAKEAGEGPLHPSVPAIANAIFDAVGIRCDALPFSPPAVLALLREIDGRAAWARARTAPAGAGGR